MAISNSTLWPFKKIRSGNIGEPRREVEVEPLEQPLEEPVPERVPVKSDPE